MLVVVAERFSIPALTTCGVISGTGVGLGVGEGDGVGVGVAPTGVGVGLAVGVTLGEGVGPPETSNFTSLRISGVDLPSAPSTCSSQVTVEAPVFGAVTAVRERSKLSTLQLVQLQT